MGLDKPITTLSWITPELEKKLSRVSIFTYRDALLHLPLRYENHADPIPFEDIAPGVKGLFIGVVMAVDYLAYGKTVVFILDGSGMCFTNPPFGALRVIFFQRGSHAPQWQEFDAWCFYGEIRQDAQGYFLSHPQIRKIDPDKFTLPQTLTPIYPTTPGLPQWTLQKLVAAVLLNSASSLHASEPGHTLGSLYDALIYIHQPPKDAVLIQDRIPWEHPAWQRLIMEELTAYHMTLQSVKEETKTLNAPACRGAVADFIASLPFQLTAAQLKAIQEITCDLARDQPMTRLLQGDVGAGKTVVAAVAAIQAIRSGLQVALMVPTEILALQHLESFQKWFAPFGITVAGWMRKTPARERTKIHGALKDGSLSILIGTHAIFQSDLVFHQLGLVIIDEQHRFGVAQRLALCSKGEAVHQLVMSATPIPRTLAQAYYSDLDISVLEGLPPGRQPIETSVLPESKRHTVMTRIVSLCADGGQVYWVCPLVDESEALQIESAVATHALLTQHLSTLRVGLLHGKMKSAEKQEIIAQFRAHALDVLVATTVVEVGVDVPRARLIVLENGERWGLAQAHQLRGRVGRGKERSYCIVLYRPPLSPLAQARLQALKSTQDGFLLAEQDLQLRGPGEILGLRQTGFRPFRVADWGRDRALLPSVIALSASLRAEHPDTAAAWMARWYCDAKILSEV